MCGCLSHAPYWVLTHNPGMCPDWELSPQPLGSQAGAQSTEPRQSGLTKTCFKNCLIWVNEVCFKIISPVSFKFLKVWLLESFH